MHAVVIPFRGPASGKSRLAAGISDAARRQIARAMFQHVLNVACAAVRAQNVLIVTGSRTAANIARRCGATVLRETISDHNAAVAQAVAHLRTRKFTTVAIVSADLPLLKPSDLAALEQCARGGRLAIATDKGGRGTNALAMPLSLGFDFHFGPASLFRHRLEARQRGVQFRLVHAPGLTDDVDTPDDLKLLAHPAALCTLPTVGRLACSQAVWTNAALTVAVSGEACT